MGTRLELQQELEEMLGSDEVYFQAPESIRLHYPAILYKKNAGDIKFADNYSYIFRDAYKITIIDRDPDATWTEKMLKRFKYIFVENQYTSDNLNHFQYRIYY